MGDARIIQLREVSSMRLCVSVCAPFNWDVCINGGDLAMRVTENQGFSNE